MTSKHHLVHVSLRVVQHQPNQSQRLQDVIRKIFNIKQSPGKKLYSQEEKV